MFCFAHERKSSRLFHNGRWEGLVKRLYGKVWKSPDSHKVSRGWMLSYPRLKLLHHRYNDLGRTGQGWHQGQCLQKDVIYVVTFFLSLLWQLKVSAFSLFTPLSWGNGFCSVRVPRKSQSWYSFLYQTKNSTGVRPLSCVYFNAHISLDCCYTRITLPSPSLGSSNSARLPDDLS